MHFFFLAADGTVYALPLTDATAVAFLWINGIFNESLTYAGRSFFTFNVCFVFLAEIAQR